MLQQESRGLQVDAASQVGIAGARRVADDRRQVDHRVRAPGCLGHGGAVAEIAPQELEFRVTPHAQQRFAAVHQAVEHLDAVALGEQQRNEGGANVAGSSGDKHVHESVALGWRTSTWQDFDTHPPG